MITVKLSGGLGNQMFQYAMGRSMAVKNKTLLNLDLSILLKRDASIDYTHRDFELNIFNLKCASIIYEKKPAGRLERFWDKTFTKYITENSSGFNKEILDTTGNIYLDGFWQNEKYFLNIRDIIMEDFSFRYEPIGVNKQLAVSAQADDSVSIHFRRGDYVTNQSANSFHGVMQPDYYHQAISIIKSQITSPHFFIFSDDITWVKENYKFEDRHTFVEHNTGGYSFEDMRLMSMCKHNIIANSSFSWWSAWLNKNKNKIVIAPQKWFNNIPTEIIPAEWTQI